MIEYVGALFGIFVMLLVVFDLSNDAGKHMLSIQNDHTRFLEVTRARHYDSLVDFYLSEIVRISLQEFFLLSQILVC